MYTGKNMIRSILPFRKNNPLLHHHIWNNNTIKCIEIEFKEKLLVTTGSNGYFNSYGIVRDIIQNHLIQILCLLGMDIDNYTTTSINDDHKNSNGTYYHHDDDNDNDVCRSSSKSSNYTSQIHIISQ